MKRFVGSLVLALLAVIVASLPAAAGRRWCAYDPIVTLNGTAVQIEVAIPQEFVPAVNGPVQVRVLTPAGVRQQVIYTDSGFNRHGEEVSFGVLEHARVRADGSFAVVIQVQVPVDPALAAALGAPAGILPVELTVTTNGQLGLDDAGRPAVVDGETAVTYGVSLGAQLRINVQGAN